MKKMKGIAILLFAILLQLASTGMEILTLGIGLVGLVIAIIDDVKKNNNFELVELKEVRKSQFATHTSGQLAPNFYN